MKPTYHEIIIPRFKPVITEKNLGSLTPTLSYFDSSEIQTDGRF